MRSSWRSETDEPPNKGMQRSVHRSGAPPLIPNVRRTRWLRPRSDLVAVVGMEAAVTALPETKYAKSGEFHIAYQVIGTGPPDLVFVHGWISHIEHMWEEPRMARFLDRLASFARLILLDKRGTGLSDPVPLDRLPTLEERMDDLRAVMDAVGSERAALMGTSEAGALSLLFAATYPSRTAALVLLNSYARLAYAPDYPHGIPADQAQGLLRAIDEGWGKGVAFEALVASQANNAPMKNWWSRYQRLAASPGAAVMLLRSAFETDARAVLAAITVPVLVLHRAGDPFTGPEHGRYVAERIHGARYVELSGVDHLFFAEDVDRLLAEVQEFLTGVREAREPDRVLATVIFVDIVGSTEQATRLGDREWRDLLIRSLLRDRATATRAVSRAGDRHRRRRSVRDLRRARTGHSLWKCHRRRGQGAGDCRPGRYPFR